MNKIYIEKDGSRFDDSDFKEVMKYAPFKIKEIKEIVACIPGAADGYAWHYVCKLKNKKWGYVTAWCDYTGWGCQENGNGKIYSTKKDLIDALPEHEEYHEERKIKKTIEDQLKGKPYGLIEIKNHE